MNDKFSIRLENVSKKFADNLRTSMAYGIRDITKDIFRLKNRSDRLRAHEFWAVDDVSFDLSRGEILGIIGSNGAGKSTLLKLINGIFFPDKGRITVKGLLGALNEIGAGFHPMLTGKENVYINAAILGIPRKKVDRKFKGIVDFSGIGDFINMPVKFYSSGMHARLGFSVAVHMDADILLVDEVLAVGDQEFQEKSMKHMVELMRANKAVIIISHSLYRIESLCNRVIWIEKGRIITAGPAKEVIKAYLDSQNIKIQQDLSALKSSVKKTVEYPVDIEKVKLLNDDKIPTTDFPFGSGMTIKIYYNAKKKIYRPQFNIRILQNGNEISDASMLIDGDGPDWVDDRGIIECEFSNLPLTPKIYDILIFVREEEGIVDIAEMRIYTKFRITDEGLEKLSSKGRMSTTLLRQNSVLYLPHKWYYY